MGWLASKETLQTFADRMARAEANGRLAEVVLEGSRYYLAPDVRIGYDIIVAVENDRPTRAFGALQRALQVFGIDRRVLIGGLGPAPFHSTEAGTEVNGDCSYAVLVGVLRDQADRALPFGHLMQRRRESDHDAVLGAEDVPLRTHVEQSHVSSPSGGVSAPTVGVGSPAGAGFPAPAGQAGAGDR